DVLVPRVGLHPVELFRGPFGAHIAHASRQGAHAVQPAGQVRRFGLATEFLRVGFEGGAIRVVVALRLLLHKVAIIAHDKLWAPLGSFLFVSLRILSPQRAQRRSILSGWTLA